MHFFQGKHLIGKRILVIGTSGSGKTTIARLLATRLGIPYHASDSFYWERNWKPASIHRVDRLLDEILVTPAWVLDGNFEHRWQAIWNRADQVVWLDYSLPRVVWQVACRNMDWFLTRRTIWSGNRMTLRHVVSGIRHSIRSHGRKRQAYPGYLAQLRHNNVAHFRCPRDVAAWIQSLRSERLEPKIPVTF